MTLRQNSIVVLPPNLFQFETVSPSSSGASTPTTNVHVTLEQHEIAESLAFLGDNLDLQAIDDHPIQGIIDPRVLVKASLAGAVLAYSSQQAVKKKDNTPYLIGAGCIALGLAVIIQNLKNS